jgi:hypothetical protein
MTDHEVLAEALQRIGHEMPPARLPADLWRRGRRRRRTRTLGSIAAATVAVLAVAVAVPLTAFPGGGLIGPATSPPGPAAPSTVYLPWPWQQTVQESPRGPAALLVSGTGAGLGYHANIAVVGRDGSYRMLLGGLSLDNRAGTDALLSPDGTRVALTWDGMGFGTDLDIVDLTTGEVQGHAIRGSAYDAMRPLGWSPDGRKVVMAAHSSVPSDAGVHDLVGLYDPASRDFRTVVSLPDASGVLSGRFPVAFASDRGRIAVQAGTSLFVVDLATGEGQRFELGGWRLAGPGAWSPEGQHLAVVGSGGDARHWRIAYLDTRAGAIVPGPKVDRVEGTAVEVLDWQDDGDLVMAAYGGAGGGSQLLALRRGGGQASLMTLPAFVERIDVARDLVLGDRFGGPAPRPAGWPLAQWVYWAAGALLVAVPLTVLWVRRRRRVRTWPGVGLLVLGLAAALPAMVWLGWWSLSLVLAAPLMITGVGGLVRSAPGSPG